jgi:hypothetical protein
LTHFGHTKAKTLARENYFWKKISTNIKIHWNSCRECVIFLSTFPKEKELEKPERPKNVFAHIGIDEYEYKGILSEIYKFEGNERFIDMVLESIGNLGQVVRDESFILSADNCQILYEAILRDAKTVPQLGDVYPQITIRNSYNGTLKKSIAFGISMNDLTNRVSCSFREKLGEIGQKHTENSQVISMGINEYLNSFTTSIEDFFNLNLNTLLQPDDILATLDLIEKVGKKRRETVSALLGDYDELEDGSRQPISAWSLFLAILRFTSTETNINAKIIVENAAVRNLVFPNQMLTALT